MEPVICKADRQYRTRLFTAYLVILILIGGLIALVIPTINNTVNRLPFAQGNRLIEAALICCLLGFIPAAIYCIVIGRKILRHDAFPWPGMKVIRDTLILRGLPAQRRGKALVILGWTFLLLMTAGISTIHWSYTRFIRNPFTY
jgi:hypothetical protein